MTRSVWILVKKVDPTIWREYGKYFYFSQVKAEKLAASDSRRTGIVCRAVEYRSVEEKP